MCGAHISNQLSFCRHVFAQDHQLPVARVHAEALQYGPVGEPVAHVITTISTGIGRMNDDAVTGFYSTMPGQQVTAVIFLANIRDTDTGEWDGCRVKHKERT